MRKKAQQIHGHTECQQPVITSLPSSPFGVQRKPYTSERRRREFSKFFLMVFFLKILKNCFRDYSLA